MSGHFESTQDIPQPTVESCLKYIAQLESRIAELESELVEWKDAYKRSQDVILKGAE